MSISVTLQAKLAAVETLTGNTSPFDAAKRKVTWDALSNKALSLTASTTVPVTKIAGGQIALSTGAKTLDLTALTALGANGATVDFSGLKVQAIFFENPSTNANSISIAPGASNGYEFNGSDAKLTLEPGQHTLIYLADSAPDVGGSAKTLDFGGTAAQPFNIVLVAG